VESNRLISKGIYCFGIANCGPNPVESRERVLKPADKKVKGLYIPFYAKCVYGLVQLHSNPDIRGVCPQTEG